LIELKTISEAQTAMQLLTFAPQRPARHGRFVAGAAVNILPLA